jgi:hypothetical protein
MDKNTNYQVLLCMCTQCVPGPFSSGLLKEPGYEDWIITPLSSSQWLNMPSLSCMYARKIWYLPQQFSMLVHPECKWSPQFPMAVKERNNSTSAHNTNSNQLTWLLATRRWSIILWKDKRVKLKSTMIKYYIPVCSPRNRKWSDPHSTIQI